MIGYSPIDEEVVQAQFQAHQRRQVAPLVSSSGGGPEKKNSFGFLQGEDTECNYLVMFFILGVLALAATDSVSR